MTQPVNSRDVRDQVLHALADQGDSHDVDAIVDDLIQKYDITGLNPAVSFDEIPADELWSVIAEHGRGRYEVREDPEVDPRALANYPDQRYCVWDVEADDYYRVDLSGSHPHDAASVTGGAPRFGPVSRESAQEMADHLNSVTS